MRRRVFFAAFCLPARQARSFRAGLPSSNLSVGLAPDSSPSRGASGEEMKPCGMPRPPLGRGGGTPSGVTERFPLSCNQTVAFFTLFSKIKGKLKNVLLKKWRICVTLHPSCNGIFGDSGVFFPSVFMALRGGGRVIPTHFFYFSARFGCFSGHLALWQGGKYGKM